jgi:5-methylcytosine-specific restriction endonuclease McrA
MSKHSARGADWEKTRQAVLDRDGWVCTSCGKTLIGFDATADHVTPTVQGGPSEAWNLVAMCRSCNSSKNDRVLTRTSFWAAGWLDGV